MPDMKKHRNWNKFSEKFSRLKIPGLKLPALRLRYQILLYLLTVLFMILSLVQVVAEVFCSIAGIVCYSLAAVTLFFSCCYLAEGIRHGAAERVKSGIESNSFTRRIAEDYRYRTVLFAVPGLALNMIFALFNGVIGFYSHSAWYGTLSAYYILLSVMRFQAVRYDRKISQEEQKEKILEGEILVYRNCGILFLIMTAALGGMVILMVCAKEGKSYPGFLIYAVAAYTFYKIILSVINLVKARKFKSPLLMAIRDIGHIDACVSILSLQTAMFASFGDGQELLMNTMNGITGVVVCVLVFCIGCYSIRSADKMKQKLSGAGGTKE